MEPTPRQTPPDPFSSDFWNEVSKGPTETVEDKIEHETVRPREDIDFSKLPSVPLIEPSDREKTKDSFSRPITKILDGETIEITPRHEITEERQISDKLEALFPDVQKLVNKTNEQMSNLILKIFQKL